jgi:hypothetical protein
MAALHAARGVADPLTNLSAVVATAPLIAAA